MSWRCFWSSALTTGRKLSSTRQYQRQLSSGGRTVRQGCRLILSFLLLLEFGRANLRLTDRFSLLLVRGTAFLALRAWSRAEEWMVQLVDILVCPDAILLLPSGKDVGIAWVSPMATFLGCTLGLFFCFIFRNHFYILNNTAKVIQEIQVTPYSQKGTSILVCLDCYYIGNYFIVEQMHKQGHQGKPKIRNWTEIAQDIGHVLRNQIVDHRQHQTNPLDLRRSAIALSKSIIKAERLPSFPANSQGKLLFQNKRIKTEQMTLKYARQTYLQRKDSFDDTYSAVYDFTPPQRQSRMTAMQQGKKRQAQMMRTFLGRLRQERTFSKIYNQRQKSYKIWRMRADKLVANSQK